MAEYDERYENWRAGDGSIHYNKADSDAHNKGNIKGENAAERGFIGAASGLLGNAVFFTILVLVACFIIFILVRQYAFYVVPWLFVLFFLKKKKRKATRISLGLSVLSCLFGAFIYYPYVKEPSPFSADYIVTETTMHTWRGFGGSTELAVGEKVTVNGITRDRKFFNITTSTGKTGWIKAAAFPEDAAQPVDDIGKIIKSILPFSNYNEKLYRDLWGKNKKAYRDRDWKNIERKVMGDYFGQKFQDGAYSGAPAGLTDKALRMAKGVNLTTPAKWRDEDGDTQDVKVTLLNVIYTPEATIVQLDVEPEEARLYLTAFEKTALKCLETGEVFPLYYEAHSDYEEQYILIFPPTQSRHFSIIHGNKPGKYSENVLWDFPEVVVGNRPVQEIKNKISDGEEIFQPYKSTVIRRFLGFNDDWSSSVQLEKDETVTVIGKNEKKDIVRIEYQGKKLQVSIGNAKNCLSPLK